MTVYLKLRLCVYYRNNGTKLFKKPKLTTTPFLFSSFTKNEHP
jgi:hypothetical protein